MEVTPINYDDKLHEIITLEYSCDEYVPSLPALEFIKASAATLWEVAL